MKRSKSFFGTQKEVPAETDSINASLLIRGGFVEKHMAGAYAYLPLGLRVIKKIEQIIREEMNKVSGQEMLMNVLQPKELWEKTGRWQEADEILYKLKDKSGKEIALAPTHEEQITNIIKYHTSSYRDLPFSLYQFQTKFRREARAKSGLLRGREFLMKDMYSFHIDDDDFNRYYDKVKKAYLKVFDRVGLKAIIVAADGGIFSKYSHEFQVLTEIGEDTIYICDKCDFAENKEIAKVADGDKCPKCGGQIKIERSIEVGNIFPLKNKYSHCLKATVKNEKGEDVEIIMGCYGIGISRLMGTIVEIHHDDRGIIWPTSVAPYLVNLISLNKNDEAENIYHTLSHEKIEVLYDDRDEVTAGEKFAEADLIGCPYRIIVSEKSLASGGVELSKRGESKKGEIVAIDEIVERIEIDH